VAPAFFGTFAGLPRESDTPIDVDIYDGSTKIASILANAYRGDVRAAGAGNGNHGFFSPTPASLKTGAAHSVTVTLGGSIREVTDANGNVVSRYDYDPYGRLTINEGIPPRFGFAIFGGPSTLWRFGSLIRPVGPGERSMCTLRVIWNSASATGC
jgi:hypothetical protein